MKGADSSIIESKGCSTAKQHMDKIREHLQTCAQEGLRTLCMASRELTEEEFDKWHSRHTAALASLSDDRATEVMRTANEIEEHDGSEVLGAIAIEDRLQDGVPESIENIRLSGIIIWVLTGDKLETAISIARSCRLLTGDMQNLVVTIDKRSISEQSSISGQLSEHMIVTENSKATYMLTITGDALGIVLAEEGMRKEFYGVAKRCTSVLCCRVSPKQKADVVELVMSLHRSQSETDETPVTLAIGDGANDVAMITTANVGVGLSGMEGAQAARAADFAIGQFRFLDRLLFVHGHESLRRNSILVNYNFYKNLVLCLSPFIYGQYTCFSGQPFYEQILYQMYNLVFTSLPCVVFALFDRPYQDLNKLQDDVWEYMPGREVKYFNVKIFAVWLVTAFLQAYSLVFIARKTMADGSISNGLTSGDMWSLGSVVYLWVILGTNVTIWRRSTVTLPIMIFVILGSVVCHPMATYTLEMVGVSELKGTFSWLYGQGCIRFGISTILFLAVHLIVGELIIGFMESLWADHIRKKESECKAKRMGSRSRDSPVCSELGYGHSNQCQFEKDNSRRLAKENLLAFGASEVVRDAEAAPLLGIQMQ